MHFPFHFLGPDGALGQYGYFGLFGIIFLESMGLPLPGETTLIVPAHWSSAEEIGPDGLVVTTLEDVFTSTLLNERAMERFVEEIVTSLPAAPDFYDTIRAVNAGKIAPPEDEVDILDVGRNQCAASTSLV